MMLWIFNLIFSGIFSNQTFGSSITRPLEVVCEANSLPPDISHIGLSFGSRKISDRLNTPNEEPPEISSSEGFVVENYQSINIRGTVYRIGAEYLRYPFQREKVYIAFSVFEEMSDGRIKRLHYKTLSESNFKTTNFSFSDLSSGAIIACYFGPNLLAKRYLGLHSSKRTPALEEQKNKSFKSNVKRK